MSDMKKEEIIQKLRDRGCRITKQRLMILDIVLEDSCSCCKEIHYKASKLDPGIGMATVYRMVNSLEEIGAITRRNIYQVPAPEPEEKDTCIIELDDNTTKQLSVQALNLVIQAGMKACGYVDNQQIKNVILCSAGNQ